MSLDDLNREQKRQLRKMGALDEQGKPSAPQRQAREASDRIGPASVPRRGPRRDAQGRLAEAAEVMPLLDHRAHHGHPVHRLVGGLDSLFGVLSDWLYE